MLSLKLCLVSSLLVAGVHGMEWTKDGPRPGSSRRRLPQFDRHELQSGQMQNSQGGARELGSGSNHSNVYHATERPRAQAAYAQPQRRAPPVAYRPPVNNQFMGDLQYGETVVGNDYGLEVVGDDDEKTDCLSCFKGKDGAQQDDQREGEPTLFGYFKQGTLYHPSMRFDYRHMMSTLKCPAKFAFYIGRAVTSLEVYAFIVIMVCFYILFQKQNALQESLGHDFDEEAPADGPDQKPLADILAEAKQPDIENPAVEMADQAVEQQA